ncbi:MAG TPA: two-component regulator propeller domain-containing protein [Verrucomicrobiae bacterium]|nr:two-component regulator propeller domain-containing protein [Verrucomicrobiae bacterium]
MRHLCWKAVILCAALARPAAALDPQLALTQYTHRAWLSDDTEGSLPQNSVFSIAQTRDGYLWMGTQEGLVRFDGVRFTVFNNRNTPAIRHNDVWKLLEAADGTLWIGTRGGGLVSHRDGVFTGYSREQGLTSEHIQALWQAADGTLWIGTRGGGLNWLRNGKFGALTAREGLSHDTVYEVLGEADGTVWIGTDGGGLDRLRDGVLTHFTTRDGLSSNTIYALHRDDEGLWIGTGAGLDRLHEGRVTVLRRRDGLSNDNVRALLRDRAGTLWIGTDGGGLNRYRDGRFDSLSSSQGLTSNSIGALFEDREGNLWVGTDAGGLNRLKDSRAVAFGTPEGLPEDNARSILEDRDGALWVGTFGGLARIEGGRVRTLGVKQGLSKDVVLSLAQTRDGAIWAGTLGGGLNRVHHGRITRFGRAEGLNNDTVLSLLEDRDGTLWAGTRSGGLHRYANGRFKALTTADGLSSDDVRYLAQARDGGLWIATLGGGVNRYVDGKFSALTKAQGLSNDLVLSLHEDARGVLWIGTFGGGLNRYHQGKFTHYTVKQGLPDDVVFQILEDDTGHLWMSSNHGVHRVAKAQLEAVAAGQAAAIEAVSFGLADGMRSAESNGAHQPAGWKGRDGRMWFPTIKGIVAIDPARLAARAPAPPVMIEEVLVNDRPVAPLAALELPPGQRKLEFRYTAPGLRAPERVQFRFRLEGFEDDWVAAGTRRVAHYTNVPPGRYTFRVAAASEDGVWNETGATQVLTLQPFFWQRRAFYAVYALGFAAVIWLATALLRRRVKELQRRERELLRLVEERRLAEDALRGANRALERRVADLAGAGPAPAAASGPGKEVTQLVGELDRLLEQLAGREHDLQQAVTDKTRANEELEGAMQQLRLAQSHLVQSEKLASLGGLVAGVAHEINTPVGIGVTAASTLDEWAQRVHRRYAAGELTRSELEGFLALARESADILLKNLQRAADLIQSFKQVAVDQASGERRHFMLKAYLEEILLSLAPKLHRSPHKVRVDCPDDLWVETYPGSLAQILTNLIANSLAHGYADGRAGTLLIWARRDGDDLVLRYADDGAGIPAAVLPRIYDPFFTTRRSAGGSGLGLHIVYNLVTQRLGGTIVATSPPEGGAHFEVRFPVARPVDQPAAPTLALVIDSR